MPYVYILRCADGSLYTGAAKDVARRVALHRAGAASRYTRSRLPVRLLWSKRVGSWGLALSVELRIKRLPRSAKEELVRAQRKGRPPRRAEPVRPSPRAARGQ